MLYDNIKNRRYLTEMIDEFYGNYIALKEEAYQQTLKTLPAGAPVPRNEGIIRQQERDAFKALCRKYQESSQTFFDSERVKTRRELAKAPSAEALAAIQALKLRKTVSELEIKSLLEEYGGNALIAGALRDLATEMGMHVYIPESPAEAKMKELEGLEKGLNNFFNTEGYHTAGFVSMLKAGVNDLYPDELKYDDDGEGWQGESWGE